MFLQHSTPDWVLIQFIWHLFCIPLKSKPTLYKLTKYRTIICFPFVFTYRFVLTSWHSKRRGNMQIAWNSNCWWRDECCCSWVTCYFIPSYYLKLNSCKTFISCFEKLSFYLNSSSRRFCLSFPAKLSFLLYTCMKFKRLYITN